MDGVYQGRLGIGGKYRALDIRGAPPKVDYVMDLTEGTPFEDNQWEDIMGFEGPDQTYWTVEYIPEIYTARFGTYGRGIWDFILNENIDILYFNPEKTWLKKRNL